MKLNKETASTVGILLQWGGCIAFTYAGYMHSPITGTIALGCVCLVWGISITLTVATAEKEAAKEKEVEDRLEMYAKLDREKRKQEGERQDNV